MKRTSLIKMSVLLGLLLLSACATLRPNFEEPSVTVTSFRALPSESIAPRFEIGLHVVNPNRSALKLHGLAYNVELEGHRILTGVSNQLPLIAAYGEGDVLLQASPDLFNTINLFAELMTQPRESFRFKLEAQLDVGWLLPKIRVEKSGEISLATKP
ncbi:MAG TPA: LEA type 2 family protein [Malonomonas sp.]